MAGLNAGDMDREVLLQRRTVTQSASGEENETWIPDTRVSDDGVLWVAWRPAGTREAWQAQQRLASYVDGVFRTYDMDPRPTPDSSRVVFDGRTYDVRPVIEIGRGEGLEIPVVARGE